jgi:hypothetical protein
VVYVIECFANKSFNASLIIQGNNNNNNNNNKLVERCIRINVLERLNIVVHIKTDLHGADSCVRQ